MSQKKPMQPEQTHLFREAADASAVVQRQVTANAEAVTNAVERLRQYQPRLVVTCARGSSDHAATYAKYLIETQLRLITASAAPSINSVYKTPQQFQQTLFIAISQSGKSPDLLTNVKAAKAAGALTLAFVNVADSPLAELVDIVIPLHAGDELSVAATKSYISSLTAILHLVSAWADSAPLIEALTKLPAALEQGWERDWEAATNAFESANNMLVIGRGLGFGIALEAALKLKETCGLHAEAFSAAEVRHGPMAIVGEGFPVLVFTQNDETLSDTLGLVQEFRQRGARVLVTDSSGAHSDSLPVTVSDHPAVTPILAVQSFYRMVNALAITRGYNPDQPPHLRKVTETH